ncbi:putative transcription factor and/or regulators TTF-type(Zn) family [Rosa chinensis]|uniref:Putative transcription factor and/or regulators TTF-type(Zn) family n=1 Tax=Rosa chinensis TaxID=74649 RepID=A0A2P6PFJ5_ROSCH|nr:putative transcription factor and/or regulators TTF-type(Zn) family [Rosa chinensis]
MVVLKFRSMPPKRKCLSGYANHLKKKKDAELVQSLRGSLDRFITREPEGLGEDLVNEEAQEHTEREYNVEEHTNRENNVEEHTDGNEVVDDLDHGENENDKGHDDNVNDADVTPVNIFYPRTWDSLDKKLIDLLVEKGPLRDLSIENDPQDKFNRHFSSTFYIQFLGNGEKYDREWLVYSKELDKVFCFCCKLLKRGPMQLRRQGDRFSNKYQSTPLEEHIILRVLDQAPFCNIFCCKLYTCIDYLASVVGSSNVGYLILYCEFVQV